MKRADTARSIFARSAMVAILSLVLAGLPAAGAQTPTGTAEAVSLEYCIQQGGTVRERTPVWGTNLQRSSWVQMGEPRSFCEFTHGPGASDASSIQIDAASFASSQPTLAVLAYLAQIPLPEDSPTDGRNPATHYCAFLGGSQSWGLQDASITGGGWVTADATTEIEVMDACVFPDGSMISAWGRTYHANGIICGADLTGLFAYQPDGTPPPVFG